MTERPAQTEDIFVALQSGMRICYRVAGEENAPAVLLVAGLAEDLTQWSDVFVNGLLGRGLRVIRMDNRDCGRSTFASHRPPGLVRQLLASPRADAYDLADMAEDCTGLLRRIGVEAAHLVGRSMGGMIAQTIAARSPETALTLTSLYSTTGDRKVGGVAASTMLMLAAPPARTRSAAVRAHLRMTEHIAGTAYPIDDAAEAAQAARTWDRTTGDAAAGTARQIQAIHASGDRTAELRRISAPTLVINGDRDRLVAPSGGAATAAAIAGARHIVVPGMGHHIPDTLADRIVGHIAEHIAQHSGQAPGIRKEAGHHG